MSVGQQAVQLGHAALDYIFEFPEQSREWHLSNYLIYLTTENEEELQKLSDTLSSKVHVCKFNEPDLNNSLTAFSFISNEETKKYTSKLKLAFAYI